MGYTAAMATLHTELYDALLAAQVPDDKARAAASTLPSINQIVKREDLKEFTTGKDLQSLRADLRLCATKEDLQHLDAKFEAYLQRLAIKEYLQRFATNDDLSRVESRLLTRMLTMTILTIVAIGVLIRFIPQIPV